MVFLMSRKFHPGFGITPSDMDISLSDLSQYADLQGKTNNWRQAAPLTYKQRLKRLNAVEVGSGKL